MSVVVLERLGKELVSLSLSTVMDLFGDFEPDTWYKAVTYLGGFILGVSLLYPIQVITNESMAVIGFGLFLFGIGRWKNVKTHSQFMGGGIVSWQDRNPDIIGIVLEFIGALMLLLQTGYLVYITIL